MQTFLSNIFEKVNTATIVLQISKEIIQCLLDDDDDDFGYKEHFIALDLFMYIYSL